MEDSVKKTGFLQPLFKKIRTAYKHPLNKEVRIFLVFFFLSLLFWWLQSLQEVREVDLRVPIEYSELTTTVSITNDLPKYLTVTLSDKGTNLYYYYRHRKDLTLHLNLMNYYSKQDIGKISISELESQLRRKVMSTTQVLRIAPESIELYFAMKKAKELPIKLNSKLSFAMQHQLADAPDIFPSTVKVFAPESIINTLQYIETETLRLNDLKDSTQVTLALKAIPGVRFETKEVKVTISVEEYTERTFTIPIVAQGFPEGSSLLAFPSKVNVTFFVGLTSYSKLRPNNFEAVVNYKDFMNSSSNQCAVRLIKQPSAIQNVRIQPNTVECLVEKNPY